MRAQEFTNESKVADIKRLARAAAKKFKAGDEAAGNNPHPAETYLGKVWRETFDKMLARIPDEPIAESEGDRKFKITYGSDWPTKYRNTRVITAPTQEEAEKWVHKWLGRVFDVEEITTEREMFPDVRTYTPQDIAKKHGVSVKQIMNQLQKGIEIEYEHTKDKSASAEIALDHLLELPDYYDRLEKMEEGEVVDFPTDKRMAQRGMQKDEVTGLWNPIPDSNQIDYVVVSDSERGQIGHATKTSRKEAEIEVKKQKLKGIDAYIVEM